METAGVSQGLHAVPDTISPEQQNTKREVLQQALAECDEAQLKEMAARVKLQQAVLEFAETQNIKQSVRGILVSHPLFSAKCLLQLPDTAPAES